MSNSKNSKEKTKEPPQNLIASLLRYLGEDPDREGLRETPERVIRIFKELLSGYEADPNSIFKTFNNNGYKELVTITNIDFYSLCEHHIVPFFGRVHIGYVPNGKILGLSKFARLVEVFARRLQTQENLTNEIAKTIDKNLKPRGLIVHVNAEHLCVSMRGIKKKNFVTKTTFSKGLLKKRTDLINQFYHDMETD